MGFVRSYFGTNEPLTRSTLFFSLFDWFAVWPVKKWGKKCLTGQRFICTKVTSYKIHTLTKIYIFFPEQYASPWFDDVVNVKSPQQYLHYSISRSKWLWTKHRSINDTTKIGRNCRNDFSRLMNNSSFLLQFIFSKKAPNNWRNLPVDLKFPI